MTTLKVGDQIILVASGYDYAMGPSSSNGNNRTQIAITKNGSIVNYTADTQIITLEAGSVGNTFAFNVGDGYLYAASSNSNHLKTKADLDDNGSWKITIDAAAAIRLPAQCASCAARDNCKACAAMVYTESGNYQAVPQYRCQMTRAYPAACKQLAAEIMKRRENNENAEQ